RGFLHGPESHVHGAGARHAADLGASPECLRPCAADGPIGLRTGRSGRDECIALRCDRAPLRAGYPVRVLRSIGSVATLEASRRVTHAALGRPPVRCAGLAALLFAALQVPAPQASARAAPAAPAAVPAARSARAPRARASTRDD